MTTKTKRYLRDIVFFLIGFIGFQILWNFVFLPLIVK